MKDFPWSIFVTMSAFLKNDHKVKTHGELGWIIWRINNPCNTKKWYGTKPSWSKQACMLRMIVAIGKAENAARVANHYALKNWSTSQCCSTSWHIVSYRLWRRRAEVMFSVISRRRSWMLSVRRWDRQVRRILQADEVWRLLILWETHFKHSACFQRFLRMLGLGQNGLPPHFPLSAVPSMYWSTLCDPHLSLRGASGIIVSQHI
jgi:hypothetical protein